MKNKLDEIIKERLENRLEWRNYLGWLLTHRSLSMNAKKEFYKDKPLSFDARIVPEQHNSASSGCAIITSISTFILKIIRYKSFSIIYC